MPVFLFVLVLSRRKATVPPPRATIKALPATLHHPRPYGWGWRILNSARATQEPPALRILICQDLLLALVQL